MVEDQLAGMDRPQARDLVSPLLAAPHRVLVAARQRHNRGRQTRTQALQLVWVGPGVRWVVQAQAQSRDQPPLRIKTSR